MKRRRHTGPPQWLMLGSWPDGSREAKAKRAWELRLDGLLLREIAAELGLKTNTAGELLADPDGSDGRARRHRHHGTCCDCGRPTYNGGSVSLPLPARCRDCEQTCAHTIERSARTSRSLTGRVKWTDDELLDLLRFAARCVAGPLTTTIYHQLRRVRPDLPSLPTINNRLNGWQNALHAAGLPTSGRTPTSAFLRRITMDDIADAAAAAWEHHGGAFTVYEYDAFSRAGDWPSQGIVRLRIPSWPEFLELGRVRSSQREAIAA